MEQIDGQDLVALLDGRLYIKRRMEKRTKDEIEVGGTKWARVI